MLQSDRHSINQKWSRVVSCKMDQSGTKYCLGPFGYDRDRGTYFPFLYLTKRQLVWLELAKASDKPAYAFNLSQYSEQLIAYKAMIKTDLARNVKHFLSTNGCSKNFTPLFFTNFFGINMMLRANQVLNQIPSQIHLKKFRIYKNGDSCRRGLHRCKVAMQAKNMWRDLSPVWN